MQSITRTLSVLPLILLLASASRAETVSPLCEDLARFSCSPGSFKDGTGEVRSSEDVEKKVAQLQTKYDGKIRQQATDALARPENSYFKELTVAALGLKNSPDCVSSEKTAQAECTKRTVEGLTALLKKKSLSHLAASDAMTASRMGDLEQQSYLLNNQVFKDLLDKNSKDIAKDIADPQLENRLRTHIFPEVKSLIAERLKSLPISEENKKFMIARLNSIQFEGTACNELGGETHVDSLLIPNAFYQKASNTFKFCNGFFLLSDSEFTISSVIAHELGHSLDPCSINYGPADMGFHYSDRNNELKSQKEFPIPNVIACLRNPQSIGALRETPAAAAGGAYGSNPSNTSVGVFCQGSDQIRESFADWMAAEVTPKYIEKNFHLTPAQYQTGYSNIARPTCDKQMHHANGSAAPQDAHPVDEKRINRITLVQPQIRAQMSCPAKHSKNIYCDPQVAFTDTTLQPSPVPGGGMGMYPGGGMMGGGYPAAPPVERPAPSTQQPANGAK